jgi:site-specific recombinase XerD
MGEREISDFLTHLAVNRKVSASTQNQALSAILFLYQKVLNLEPEWLEDVVRAKRPQHLPVILSRQEIKCLFEHMHGMSGLIARALYGTGMRKMECLRLRVQDIDFNYQHITARSGKGDKDRVTVLPELLIEPLQKQLDMTCLTHK